MRLNLLLHYAYEVEQYTLIVGVPTTILISCLWLLYFLRQARLNYKQWNRNRKCNETESLKRKMFFNKSVLIIFLLVADIIIFAGSFVETCSTFIEIGNLTDQLMLPDYPGCTVRKHTWLATIVYERGNSSSYLEGIWQSALLAEFCIFIAILRYFWRISIEQNPHKERQDYSLKKDTLFILLIIFPQSILILWFDASPSMIMIGHLVFGIMMVIYSVVGVRSSQQLYRQLKWNNADLKLHFHSKVEQRNDSYNLKMYKYSTIAIIITALLYVTAEVCYIIFNVWIGTILLNACWFNKQYTFMQLEFAMSMNQIYQYRRVTYCMAIFRNGAQIIFIIYVLSLNAVFFVVELIRRRNLKKLLREKPWEGLNKPLLENAP